MRILLAEDEKPLARVVSKLLEKNNYSVDVVYNGADALDYLSAGNYDLAILDIMMPKKDGITVLREIRAAGNDIPVLMLTAKAETDDKVLGLDSGANDYLTKPFETKELLARIRAATRGRSAQDSRLTMGNMTLDRATFELKSPTGCYRLANKEYQIMEQFMANPHTLLTAERLFEKIWGYDNEADVNVVCVYISYLRKKLTALHADVTIRSSRNAGYALEEKDG